MIRVNFILGFLGAGKTTFIKSLLQKEIFGKERIVLLVNDYGPENYDSTLLRETGVEIIEITNGCLCCSNQHDFHDILQDLSQRRDIDRIIIEPSGLFMPNQVIPELQKESPNKKWQLQPVCVLVDMAFLSGANRAWPPFISRHIEIADYIITNKQEQVESDNIKDICLKLHRINDKAHVVGFPEALDKFITLKLRTNIVNELANDVEHNVKLEVRTGLTFQSTEDLENYFNAQSETMLRAKGQVTIAGKPMRINYTQTSLEVTVSNTTQSLSLACFLL